LAAADAVHVCKACGAHTENKEHLLIHCSMYTRVRQRFPEFTLASLLDSMRNTHQHKVAEYVSGCFAARDSVLARAARAWLQEVKVTLFL